MSALWRVFPESSRTVRFASPRLLLIDCTPWFDDIAEVALVSKAFLICNALAMRYSTQERKMTVSCWHPERVGELRSRWSETLDAIMFESRRTLMLDSGILECATLQDALQWSRSNLTYGFELCREAR
jgi:hypothetical protein